MQADAGGRTFAELYGVAALLPEVVWLGGHEHVYERVIIDRPFLGRGNGMLDHAEVIAGYRCVCGARSIERGTETEKWERWEAMFDPLANALAAMRERYAWAARAWEVYRRPKASVQCEAQPCTDDGGGGVARFLVIELTGDNPQLHERARRIAVEAIEEQQAVSNIGLSVVLPNDAELRRRVGEQDALLRAYVAVAESWT